MDREKTLKSDQWDIEMLYPSLDDWEKDFIFWGGQKKEPHWPKFVPFRSRLHDGASAILELLNYYFSVEHHLHKLYTYAHLRHDEDVGNEAHKQIFLRISALLNDFQKESSWIGPEFLQLSDEKWEQLLNSVELEPFKFYLEKIIRQKPHMLNPEGETLIASASLALDTLERVFGAFNNGDLTFPQVEDSQGKTHVLTHGTYSIYLRDPDRELRKNSFKALHLTYMNWENTLCELIQGEVLKHCFTMKARKFSSCLEAALFPHHIDTKLYTSLISTVRQNIKSLHRYMNLRKEVLQLEELHLYDVQLSLVPEAAMKIPFEEAAKLVIDSVAPLGSAYQSELEKGLMKTRWVDRYENIRKRSGAYSSGCYGSIPYILMNYQDHFQDVMTLAHEAGHSMHSLLAWKAQPYHNASYPIFVAEVASTFNEELLRLHLLKILDDPLKKAYLIYQKMENIRNTLFRQVMFAEFELEIHQRVERGIPLTPAFLKTFYHQLNVDYFGPSIICDSEISIEWARIPHFYYNFYVYQYATGLSASYALMDLVLKSSPEHYLNLLSSGGSLPPLKLLQQAGVDMYTLQPIESTIELFNLSMEELKRSWIDFK